MGVYLSSPVTEKESVDGQCDRFVYGASSMQGWRISQEDAHNCIPLFHESTKTSFFAVYDGHGGSEVAKYCEKHFPEFVKNLMETHGDTKDPALFIKDAFLEFDATLTKEDVVKELKVLAGNDDDNEEDDEDDPVGRTEAELLKEEANMPLDQLLAQYKNTTAEENNSQEKFISKSGSSSDAGNCSLDTQNGQSSSSSVPTSSLSSCKNDNSSNVTNGKDGVHNSSEIDSSETLVLANTASDNSDQHSSDCSNNNTDKMANSSVHNCLSSPGEPLLPSSSSKSISQAADNHSHNKLADSGSSSSSTDSSHPSGSSGCSHSSLDSTKPGGSTSETQSSKAKIDEPSVSGTSSSAGTRSCKAKAAVDIAKMDGDDTSDEDDEEDVWEDMSDDSDEEEEDEEEPDEDVPVMDTNDEEPGSDSGCTACVVLMQGKKLIVANAGDSRCVLSRSGKAVDLSFDHKPEDDREKERIEHAGGKVTADGRVNGGLNLSRAIGDHVYKCNKDLPAEEQMITALPDIETAELCDEDQFIVIACDGIWNYLSSQEVVDFVLEKLKDPEKRQKPSAICEELFDHCLAPNTSGDGTGCDNMTCIIIILETFSSSRLEPTMYKAAHTNEAVNKNTENFSEQQLSNESRDAGLGSLKRCAADNLEVSEEKRLKVNEEIA